MSAVKARGNPFLCIPTRYVFGIHASVGMGIIYGLKVCMSVALVGMVNNTAIALESSTGGHENIGTGCPNIDAETSTDDDKGEDGPYNWDANIQGLILSSYFWGYLISNVPGGQLSEMFSAKWVMFFSVAINVVCVLLTPVLANVSWIWVIIMRILEGIGGGVTFPACHVLLSKWAPIDERSILSAITYAGTSLGTVISLLGSGLIAAAWGWEAIFYVFGGLSLIWLAMWTIFIYDTPMKQPFISQKERDKITESLGSNENEEKLPTPWKSIAKSVPVWAIIVTHTCMNWGWYLFLIELPLFMKQVLHFKISENAVRIAIPYLTLWLFSMILSKTLDILRSKEIITTTFARKISTAISSVIPTCCLVGIYINGCDRTLVVTLLTIGITAMGAMFCGYLSNHIDLAPNFAGTLVALSNTPATISGILVPIFIGVLTHTDPTIRSWQIVFLVTMVVFVIAFIVYTMFGSGEEQPWNKSDVQTRLKQ